MLQNQLLLQLKQHLSGVSQKALADKIRHFRRLNFRRLTYTEIQSEISKVLNFQDRAIFLPTFGIYPAGTLFFRVRAVSPDDHMFPLRVMSVESDAWAPPPSVVSIQRLNKTGESVLYTTPVNFVTAIEEARIQKGQRLALIVYRAKTAINVVNVAAGHLPPELSSDDREKLQQLNDFFEHEFTREVGRGTEHLYQISEIIAKDYFDLPPDFQDGWCYPSVVERGSVNVCFRPEKAKAKLELVGVQIGEYFADGSRTGLNVRVVAIGFDQEGKFKYYPVGSEEQKLAFPEIVLSD